MELFSRAYKRIPRWIVLCFAATMLSGLLVHAFMLTNKLPNHDDVAFLDSVGYTLVSGRWFLALIGRMFSSWSIPWVNGLLSFGAIGASACLMLATLRQRDGVSAVVLPLLLVVFPSTANILSYMFFSSAYFFGMLLACLAVYCIRSSRRWGWIAGIPILACALGVYQAHVCMAAGLLLLGLIRDLLDTEWADRDAATGLWRAALGLALGVAAYYLVLQIALRVSGSALLSYQGINDMGKLSLAALPGLCWKACKAIADYFLLDPPGFVRLPLAVFHALLCVMMGGMFAWLLLHQKQRPLWRSALSLLALAALPVALAGVYVIAPSAQVHMVMCYAYVLFYVLALVLMQAFLRDCPAQRSRRSLQTAVAGLTMLCLLGSAISNALVDNRAYFASRLAFDKTYAFFNRMVMRIEDSGCFAPGDTLAIVGDCQSDFFGTEDLYAELDGMTGFDKASDALDYDAGARHDFITTYVGLNAAYDDYYQWNWRQVDEILEMPAYPAPGSIRRVGDAVIVKMEG